MSRVAKKRMAEPIGLTPLELSDAGLMWRAYASLLRLRVDRSGLFGYVSASEGARAVPLSAGCSHSGPSGHDHRRTPVRHWRADRCD